MATLNTLRTRFGVVLSVFIAFALLAFIFSLKSDIGFSGNDPVVAKIDGQELTYSQYYAEYNRLVEQNGLTDITPDQAQWLYTSTWQSLISKIALKPAYEKMGITISAAERMAIIRGEIPTQTMYSIFADPSTGMYNINALNSFLFTSQNDPQAEAMWSNIVTMALDERASLKFAGLVNGGTNLNDYEVEEGVRSSNKSFSGRWISKRYSDVADDAVSVSDAEVKSYYEANKESFKRTPTRSLLYVEIPVSASAADMTALQAKATELTESLAEVADIKAFIRESRSGSVAATYVSEKELDSDKAAELIAGKTFGPVQEGMSLVSSRVEDTLYASDSLSLRHIVLSYTDAQLADSLCTALSKATDEDFVAAASTYSVYQQTAQNGGDLGTMPFSVMSDEFSKVLAPARKGDVVKVEVGDMIQVVRVYDAGPRVKQYKLATIEVPIAPSQETRTMMHNTAGLFVSDAKGGASKFQEAANESKLSYKSVDIIPSSRLIPAIVGSEAIARWAHSAKEGELSQIFTTDAGYAVAMLTAISDSEYRTLSDVESSIRRKLTSQKKFDYLKGQLSGSTFAAMAESLGATEAEFSNVSFGSYYIPSLGVEPRVVGAIASSTATGVASAPIMGTSAMYIFVVDSVNDTDYPQTAEAEKVRVLSIQQQMIQQSLFDAMESMLSIEDKRGANL
ncbi:MAG: SurA N-terminal domain-containing protein [Rikenellaceae bacterium]